MSEINLNLLRDLKDLKNLNKENNTFDVICKPPFPWVGGKSRIVNKILHELPYKSKYIEPFGGSGIVLLNRSESNIEVFNDRHSGIVDFYKCLRDKELLLKLEEYINLLTYSREDFLICKNTWENTDDVVERAAKWYWSIFTSFSGLGRNFGRPLKAIRSSSIISKINNKFKLFWDINNRIKNVILENQDWRELVNSYDSTDAVFYLDPPYIDCYAGTYKYSFKDSDHISMLNTVFTMDSFVAVSSYDNDIYNSYNWSRIIEMDSFVTMHRQIESGHNNKTHMAHLHREINTKEMLYIKE